MPEPLKSVKPVPTILANQVFMRALAPPVRVEDAARHRIRPVNDSTIYHGSSLNCEITKVGSMLR